MLLLIFLFVLVKNPVLNYLLASLIVGAMAYVAIQIFGKTEFFQHWKYGLYIVGIGILLLLHMILLGLV